MGFRAGIGVVLVASMTQAQVGQEKPADQKSHARLLVCDDSILSLASDGEHIFTGHLWGIGMRDAAGTVLRRWPIGFPVEHLACCQGLLFAATSGGLFQMHVATGTIERVAPPPPDVNWGHSDESSEPIRTLSASSKVVWVGTVTTVRRYDPARKTVQVYSWDRLGFGESGASHVEFILADKKGAWIEAFGGVLRMDEAGNKVHFFRAGSSDLKICGVTAGAVWAVAKMGNQGVRPYRLDADATKATDVPIGVAIAEIQNRVGSGFSLVGRRGEDALVFEEERGRRLWWHAGKLEEMEKGIAFERFAIREVRPSGNSVRWVADMDVIDDAPPEVCTRVHQRWQAESGPGDLRLVGASNQIWGAVQYLDSHANPRQLRDWATERQLDGLWMRKAGGAWTKAPPVQGGESLPCDAVYSADIIGSQVWLCGPGGVMVSNPDGTIVKRYTIADGLPTNRAYQSAELEGAVYVAGGSTGKGDFRGSLAVLPKGADRFASVPLDDVFVQELGDLLGVTACGDELKLTFADAREVRGLDPSTHRARMWHPSTRAFRNASADEMKQGSPPPVTFRNDAVPFLEGQSTFQLTIGPYHWTGGSRGVCVWSGDAPSVQYPPIVSYRKLANPSDGWKDDARLAQVGKASAKQLRAWLTDSNALLRAKAMGQLPAPTEAELRRAFKDSYSPVPRAALSHVVADRSAAALPLLRVAISNSEPSLRDDAVLGLLERGELPPMEILRDSAARQNFAYGSKFWRSLVPLANVEVLELMQEHEHGSLRLDQGDFAGLGKALAREPAALEKLAAGQVLNVSEERDSRGVPFIMRVAVGAGAAILPTVHPWLAREDHRWRIFSAQVCGGIHDPASLEPLTAAFRKDDGLALGPIIEALGELRDPGVIPELIELYSKAHDVLASLGGLYGSSYPVWIRDEQLRTKFQKDRNGRLMHSDLPKGSKPVLPHDITGAIERIGPEHAQPFYRALARGPQPSYYARTAVARGLRSVEGPEGEENIAILRTLLRDTQEEGKPADVAREAAVTLLLFGIHDGDSLIIQTLQRKDSYDSIRLMERLREIPRADRAFANEALRAWKSHHGSYSDTKVVDELLK